MFLSLKFSTSKVLISIISTVLFICALVALPAVSQAGVSRGLLLCYTVLIPSLFPYFFALDYLYSLLLSSDRLKSKTVLILISFVLSLVGGYPMGARILSCLVERGVLSKAEASVYLCAFVNAGPAYLISGVGLSLFKSETVGALLFFSLCISSVLCFLLSMLVVTRLKPPCAEAKTITSSASAELSVSLSNAVSSTFRLCSYVILFSCLIEIIKYALSLLSLHSEKLLWLVSTIIEVSTAAGYAAKISSTQGAFLALASVSLCSASVVLQIRAFTRSKEISLLPFFLSRPLHLLFSLCLFKLFLSLPLGKAAFTFLSVGRLSVAAFSVSPFVSFFLFLASFILLVGNKKISLFTN